MGFEPTKLYATDLESAPFDQLGYTGIPRSPEHLVLLTFQPQLHLILLRILLRLDFGSPAPLETGIEPVTSRLTVVRSNQLSYSSKFKIFLFPIRVSIPVLRGESSIS